MKLLVTGSTGFLGRAIVAAALRAGHDVVAMVRPAVDMRSVPWCDERVTTVRGDLRQRGPWVDAIGEVDAVIHAAAATSGDLTAQFAGTVTSTEHLLDALSPSACSRMVHVSSFSVYDFAAIPTGGVLDETAPLEPEPERRDPYTITKLLQERLVREACDRADRELVVVRPGAIYGPGTEWQHGAAFTTGRWAVVYSPSAPLRLTNVANCAEAIVLATSRSGAGGSTINIVDDDLPTHLEYFRLCRRAGLTDRRPVPVPWNGVAGIGRLSDLADRLTPAHPLKLPELVEWRRQQARWKPMHYSNDKAKRLLGWSPDIEIAEGVAQMAKVSR